MLAAITHRTRPIIRLAAVVALVATLTGLASAATAQAAGLSPDRFGVNIRLQPVHNTLQPTDLSVGAANGLGTVRYPINAGWNADQLFTLTASAGVRMYPQLGLPTTEAPSAAAADMAQFITQFAQRYGPNGSFWTANPQLPYLPVQRFEIGNEPNMPLQWVDDSNHLHWSDPTAYAQVYTSARAALHAVDPSGVAVVGGLGDSASYGVDVQHDEQWLAALDPSTVDAVGFHPYTYQVSNSLMKPDTAALRAWMNAHGLGSASLDINEFDNCEITAAKTNASQCRVSSTSAQWGQIASDYTQWAVCNPSLNVATVLPFYWGSTTFTDADTWMTMMAGDGTLTPYGQAYLGTVHQLTTSGCPNLAPAAQSGPTVQGTATSGSRLTADPGIWSGDPQPALAYQWQRCDAAGQSCAAIAGATATSYTVQPGDAGSKIRLVITAGNAAGSATAASQPTAVVPGAAPASASPGKGSSGGSSGSSGAGKSKGTDSSGSSDSSSKGDSASSGRATGKATTARVRLDALGRAATRLRIVRVRRHGRRVEVIVAPGKGARALRGVAVAPHHHRVRLRINHRYRSRTLVDLVGTLAGGRWTVTVSARGARGYASPKSVRRSLRVRG